MSWNSPTNWNEILFSVERGFGFVARRHRVAAEHAAVCGDLRRVLTGHIGDFERDIIAKDTALHEDYMNGFVRSEAWKPDTPLYLVTRDGNALAYVTRGGDVVTNPETERAPRRYRDALERLAPALHAFAERAAAQPRSDWL